MQKQSLVVISSYPPRGETHHKLLVGVASYTKNTLLSLKKANPNLAITVLAEKIDGQGDYIEDAVTVKRVWKRGSLLTFPTLFKNILSLPSKNILIELELAMFGDMLTLVPFPLFLLLLKLFGKQTTIVLHQVVPDVNEMHGHIDIQKNSIRSVLLNFCVQSLYRTIGVFSNQIIVFEEVLKQKLSPFVSHSNKIKVIPHMVEDFSPIPTQENARKQLDIPLKNKVLLSFGFLAWYKGTDILIEQFKAIPKTDRENISLIIAGGSNINHVGKPHYDKYIADITKICKEEGILLTGFVPEDKIATYFSASDLVVFPYRTFMSSSGPLSMAFSFEKPFLLSEPLKRYVDTTDFKTALEKVGLTREDVTYPLTTDGLRNKLKELKNNKIAQVSRIIKQGRSGRAIGTLYYDCIFLQ